MTMRHLAVIAFVWVCAIPGAAFGQAKEWKEFVSKDDRFSVNFPGDPVVTDIVWVSEYGARLPGRVYSVQDGQRFYSMTTVDYTLAKELDAARAKACPDQDDELCTGHTSFSGPGYWKNDVRGAMIFAALKFMKRPDTEVGHYMWNYYGMGIEVNELQLANNVKKTRTFVSISMHHSRLYVMEATVPQNVPPPGLFQQSISLFEEDGKRTSHGHVVFNGAEIEPNETSARRPRPGDAPAGGQAAPGGRPATP